MLYTGLSTPVLFASGEVDSVRELLAELDPWPKLYLLIRPGIVNRVALKIYERLGYVQYCEFYEGVAEPLHGGDPSGIIPNAPG